MHTAKGYPVRSGANRIKQPRVDTIFDIVNYAALALLLFLIAYPLLFVLSASVSDPQAVASGKVILWPVGFNLLGYKKILGYTSIWVGYRNTLFYAALGTAINLFMTVTLAFPLSRSDFKARGIINLMITITMFFSGGMIPSYLVVRSLGLINTVWAVMIPVALSTWNVIITRTNFQTNIPKELQEAAACDGCTNLRFLLSVVLPLSMPVLAVMVLYYASGHWNSYFNAMLYLQNERLFPLQLFLRRIFIQNETMDILTADPSAILEQQRLAGLIKYCIIVVATVPMLILYPFIQKHFVKGVMVGSIKG